MINADLQYLNELNWGYRAGRVLHVANEIGVFNALAGKTMCAADIASSCNSKVDMTEKLLIACTALSLIERNGDNYTNTGLADKYLIAGKELFQGDIIAHSSSVWNFWNELPNAIRPEGSAAKQNDEHRNFILAMRNITAGGRGDIFLDHIDLSGRKKMFDVGGGPGMYSILACRKWPGLRATVFDLPETIEIAKKIVASEQMEDRIDFAPGNWDDDEFGNNNDVVLFSNVLHGPTYNVEHKLAKAHASMTKGGLLVIQEFVLNNEKTGPLISALFNVMVGAYSQNELLAVIIAAGFTNAIIAAKDDEIGSCWITAEKA